MPIKEHRYYACLKFPGNSFYVNSAYATVNQTIFVPFTPDEVIVRQVSFENPASEGDAITSVVECRTNLVHGPFFICNLANDISSVSLQMDIAHSLNKPVSGSYTFDLVDVTGVGVPYTEALMILLEFVTYKSYGKK